MEQRAISFNCEFSDGYSFRNLIEVLKNFHSAGNFYFYADKIIFFQADSTNTVINHVHLRRCDLPQYFYNFPAENFRVGINLTNFRLITKSIARKDGFIIQMQENDSRIHCNVCSSNSRGGMDNSRTITPQEVEPFNMSIPQYKRKDSEPTCTISIGEFCKKCSSIVVMKYQYITITGYPKGIYMAGINDANISSAGIEFGECNEERREGHTEVNGQRKIMILRVKQNSNRDEIRVPINIIKSLSKIANICPNGSVKIYMEDDKPLKIVFPVGSYGNYTCLIRDTPVAK